jgi:hypothetical protein
VSLCGYQARAIKSFHNYATPDRCIVQRETLKGLSVERGKKRLRRETEKERAMPGGSEPKQDREELEWINERWRLRGERGRE